MLTRVTIGNSIGEIDDKIYGQFIEHALDCINGGIYEPENALSDEQGFRKDVVDLVKELAPSTIRFPGGTIMCQYHWEDAVGPKEDRKIQKNLIWGGELDPSFGTAEFVTLCRRVGAEPMLCINMESGTPEEAGNWVEYCNGTGNSYYAKLRRKHGFEEPFQVKYWCIGNESYSEFDMGIHHDVKLYVRDAMEYIKRMKLTDDNIKTVIVGSSDMEWNKAVLDGLHPVTDYLSVHHYSTTEGLGLYGPFEGKKALESLLTEMAELIDTYPESVTDFNPWYRFSPRKDKIKIAVDEWNIWDFVPDATYGLKPVYCWRDAVWAADMLNMFISRPEIGMANLAQMVNVLSAIVAEEKGSWFQTIAYPLKLYREHLTGKRLDVKTVSISEEESASESELKNGLEKKSEKRFAPLSIAAVRTKEGNIKIAAVNRDFENCHSIYIEDLLEKSESAEMIVLEGSSPYAVCSFKSSCVMQHSEKIRGNSISIPAGSICVIILAP